jgi:hypothetical protein
MRLVAVLLLALPLVPASAEVSKMAVSADLPLAFVAGETSRQFSTVYRSAEIRSEEVRIRTPKAAFSIVLRGARSVAGTAEAKLPGIANYYHGRDPKQWRTGLPTFGRVRFDEVYPGISVVYYGTEQRLEFDLELQPGADLARVELEFRGCQSVQKASDTTAALRCGNETLPFAVPLAYQKAKDGTREPVRAAMRVTGANRLAFSVSGHDPKRAVVIDPTLTYSSYLFDKPVKVAIASTSNIYVTGTKLFPNQDGFLRKLNPTGSTILSDTIFGGSGQNTSFYFTTPSDIAIDASENVYVAGDTTSVNFPTTPSAFQPIYVGPRECVFRSPGIPCSRGFVTKFSSDGRTMLYSTYLGGQGTSFDHIRGLGVNASGEAYVAGGTDSLDFPVTPGAYIDTPGAGGGFVTRLNSSGSGLVYSTLLPVGVTDMALDSSGNVFVATGSVTPTPGALQIVSVGASIVKLNPSGSGLVWATSLDGGIQALAIDSAGSVYFTGQAGSVFVTTPGAFRASQAASCVGSTAPLECAKYVRKISPAGDTLIYSTLIGIAALRDIAVDSAGRAVVVGDASHPQFTGGILDYPLVDSLQTQLGQDAVMTKLSADGSSMVYSTLFGGSSREQGNGVVSGPNDIAYVTGTTESNDLLTTAGAAQSLPQMPVTQGFLIKLTDTPGVVPPNLEINLQANTPSSQTINTGDTAGFFLQVTGRNLTDPVTFSCSNLPENSRCIFAPTSLTISGTGVQPVNLGIQTGVQSASVITPRMQFAAMFLVGLFGLVMAGSARGPRKRWTAVWLGLLVASSLIALGCGGGAGSDSSVFGPPVPPSQPPPPPTFTPSQTRTVTVSAHSGNLVRSMQVSVTIR